MHRAPSALFAIALAAALLAGDPASAGVHVRATLASDQLPLCGVAHFNAALWNTGTDTVQVRVSISLIHENATPLGAVIGGARLLPGEVRTRAFDVPIPSRLRPGVYALTLRAFGPDGDPDQVVLRFTVAAADCPPPAIATDPGLALMSSVSSGLSLEPDRATPTLHNTWGQLKVRYRR